MKQFRLLVLAVLAALSLALGAAACGGSDNKTGGTPTSVVVADTATPPAAQTPAATSTPAASDIAEDSAPVTNARQTLLDNVDLNPADLRFVSATAKQFSNACLDINQLTATPEVCAQVITPGYEIIFQVGATVYTYHTDESGGLVRFAGVSIGGGPTPITIP